MKFFIFTLLLSSIFFTSLSQGVSRSVGLVDLNVGFASRETTFSLAYLHDWGLGKKKKFNLGTGARLTSYFAKDQYYLTAPANLTSRQTGPQVIFIENIKENIDSFLITSPSVYSLNVLINISYQFSPKLSVGFNIDILGFSIGENKEGKYINGALNKNETAKPTTFNALLVSDNDLGSLNSEFYGRYFFNEKWGAKLAAQFLFTEYTADTYLQQLPELNDRFRRKSLLLSIGVSRKL